MNSEAAPPEPLRTIELAGTPMAMGEAFGEQFREEIVETTAQQSVRTVVEEQVFVHANHHLAESLKPLEFPRHSLANSQRRHERLAAAFAVLQSPITMDACWSQLANVVQVSGEHSAVATCATVVLCPAARTLHVCAGGPRAGNQRQFTV